MQHLLRAIVVSVVATSAALLIGAGTANAVTPATALATPPSTAVLLADDPVSGTLDDLGNVVYDVVDTLDSVLSLLGV